MKKLAHKTEIAEWYAQQIMEHSTTPYNETALYKGLIEWLVMNLKEDAMELVAENYYEHIKELEELNK